MIGERRLQVMELGLVDALLDVAALRSLLKLEADGVIGPATLGALQAFLAQRGAEGETVLLRMLNALQGARYIEISDSRPANEDFTFGWFRTRVAM